MSTFKEIENQENLVNGLLEKAFNTDSDEDWLDYVKELNKIGPMIQEYGRNYRRQKKIKILLSES